MCEVQDVENNNTGQEDGDEKERKAMRIVMIDEEESGRQSRLGSSHVISSHLIYSN